MMMTSSRGLSQLFFTRARHSSVPQCSKTRISCSHPCTRKNKKLPTLANKGSRKRKPHKLMVKARRTLETRLIVQQCAQQHILPSMFACRPKKKKEKDTTVEISTREPRIPENMVGTKNTNNFKTRISSTLAEHDRGLFIQFVTKTSRSLAK